MLHSLLIMLSAVFLARAATKAELSKNRIDSLLPSPSCDKVSYVNISVLGAHSADRITAIVRLSSAPPFLVLQSSLSAICTRKPFGDFEFGSFASVKFSAQTFFSFSFFDSLGRIRIMAWRCSGGERRCKNKTFKHSERWSHLVATLEPETDGGQRGPSSSKGSRQRANSLL